MVSGATQAASPAISAVEFANWLSPAPLLRPQQGEVPNGGVGRFSPAPGDAFIGSGCQPSFQNILKILNVVTIRTGRLCHLRHGSVLKVVEMACEWVNQALVG